MKWSGYVACVGETRSTYKILIKKPERKRPLGRYRHRWEDDIRMDLREIVWEDVDWTCLAWDRAH
jgi:hypothetical protein